MRSPLFLTFLTLCLTGCSRNGHIPEKPPEEPGIPPATLITTDVMGNASTPDDQAYSNIFLYYTGKNWPINNTFLVEGAETDKYFSHFVLNDPSGVEKNKTVALTSSGLNYLRLKPMPVYGAGWFTNGNGGTITNDTWGSITFPPNSIYQTGNPGFLSPGLKPTVIVGYLPVNSIDFGVSTPCYLAADENNKRQFLQSYGILDFQMGYVHPYSGTNDYEINGGYSATIRLKIPDKAMAPAPDSVALWRLTDGVWKRSGTAKKEGLFYTATITRMGVYNFAQTVPGHYRYIRYLSVTGQPIINAPVRIKYQGWVLHESQTDWAGYQVAFLPDVSPFDPEIYYRGRGIITSFALPSFSSIDHKDTVAVKLPATRYLFSLKGQAQRCNGELIKKGKVIIKGGVLDQVWHVPIINGRFEASVLNDNYDSLVYSLKVVDPEKNITGHDTAVFVKNNQTDNFVINTCPVDSSLYMKMSIDGQLQTVTGHLSNINNPSLRAYVLGDNLIEYSSDILSFDTHGLAPGVYTGSGIMSLFVNKKLYYYNVSKPMRITILRYDLLKGFVVGSADFWYTDESNVSRHLEASFRLWK